DKRYTLPAPLVGPVPAGSVVHPRDPRRRRGREERFFPTTPGQTKTKQPPATRRSAAWPEGTKVAGSRSEAERRHDPEGGTGNLYPYALPCMRPQQIRRDRFRERRAKMRANAVAPIQTPAAPGHPRKPGIYWSPVTRSRPDGLHTSRAIHEGCPGGYP